MKLIMRCLGAVLLGFLTTPVWAAEVHGQLDWSRRTELAGTVSGQVERVAVEAGQAVPAGALLVQIEATQAKAHLAEMRADWQRWSAEEADAQRELGRVKELYARTVSSTTELDTAALRLVRAQAQASAAQARVEKARRYLAETEIRAPFPAFILERRAEPGMASPANCQPPVLVVIAHADELIIRAVVSATEAATLGLGREVEAQIQEATVWVRIRALRALPDGRYQVEAVLPRTPNRMAGMAASIRLP